MAAFLYIAGFYIAGFLHCRFFAVPVFCSAGFLQCRFLNIAGFLPVAFADCCGWLCGWLWASKAGCEAKGLRRPSCFTDHPDYGRQAKSGG
jgi:hypothetical protein